MQKREMKETGVYFLLTSLMLAGFSLVLLMLKLKATETYTFFVSNRYFIALTPIGIIAVTLSSIYLAKAPKNKIGKMAIALGLLILLIIRWERTLSLIRGCSFLNLPF